MSGRLAGAAALAVFARVRVLTFPMPFRCRPGFLPFLHISLISTALVAQPFLAVLPYADTQSGRGLANRKPFL